MFKNYIKIAVRTLLRNKTFSLINIFGLTLGIACSLAIFMIVRYEFSFDTFHPDHSRIYRVVADFRYPEGIEYQAGVPYPLPEAVKLDFPQVEKVATIMSERASQMEAADLQKNIPGKTFKEDGIFYTSPVFFEVFAFHWLYGDPSTALLKPNTIALTRQMAEKYFGAWQQAI